MIKNKVNILKNGKPIIGLLGGSFSSTYHEAIINGAKEAALKHGVNLITFCAGPIDNPDAFSQKRDTLFDLVDTNFFDGLIIPVSSHSRYITKDETEKFLTRFKGIPTVNIGSYQDGVTNLLLDYKVGISELFDHLINIHGYKKIVLFRGPKNHATSNSRTEFFKNELRKHGLPYSDDLVIEAELRATGAKDAVRELLDRHGNSVDAIFSINDNLAHGAIVELNNMGICIPDDIAIIGSMDSEVCRFTNPQMTSINEPLFKLGSMAVESLLKEINTGSKEDLVTLPTNLYIRESCGCRNESKGKFSLVSNGNLDRDQLYNRYRDILVQNKCYSDHDILLELLDILEESISSGDWSNFIQSVSDYLTELVNDKHVTGWLSVSDQFLLDLINARDSDTSVIDLKSINKLGEINIRIKELISNNRENELDRYNKNYRDMTNSLNLSFDMNTIKSYIIEILGINDVFISTYIGDDISKATNVLAVRDREFIMINQKRRVIDTKELIPQESSPFRETYSFVIFPLSYRKKPLGYLMTNHVDGIGSIYENLQVIISTALKNDLQIQDLKSAEERFSDIAHSTSNWLWETDINHNFTYSSISVYNVLGYENIEVLGKPLTSFLAEKTNSFLQLMESGSAIRDIECIFKHKNSNSINLVMSARPIKKHGVFTGYRGVFEDITEKKLKDKRIEYLAYFDILTDLPNRAQFNEKLNRIIEVSNIKNLRFAIMFLDLNKFKEINDTLGHSEGDLLLKNIADILKRSTREVDTVARLGGDEFTILLPDITDETQIVSIAERILEEVNRPIQLTNDVVQAGVSIGISVFPNDGRDSDKLMKNSDNAMYLAKRRSDKSYVFYNKDIESNDIKRHIFEDLLESAINRNSFIIHYQPQVDIESNSIVGLESFVRLENRDQKIIYPDQFLSLAANMGIIGKLNNIVLESICKQIAIWRSSGVKIVPLSINISSYEVSHHSFANDFINIMSQYKIPFDMIHIEIEERSLIEMDETTNSNLEILQSSGCKIVLSNFGSSYSSIKSLNSSFIDVVKLDREYVKTSMDDNNREVLKAIIILAKGLGVDVIAESIESEEEYNFIREIGCSKYQGYYFSEAMEAKGVEGLL